MESPPVLDAIDEEQSEVTTADLAGFWIRLAAFVIDIGILTGGSGVIAFIVGCLTGATGLFEFPSLSLSSRLLFGLIVVSSGVYFPWSWKHNGQTLGKRALGIRVIRTDVRHLDWNASLVRFLGYVVSWACLAIPFLLVGFDARKQGLHDKMAGTYVIVIPKKKVRVTQPHVRAAVEHV